MHELLVHLHAPCLCSFAERFTLRRNHSSGYRNIDIVQYISNLKSGMRGDMSVEDEKEGPVQTTQNTPPNPVRMVPPPQAQDTAAIVAQLEQRVKSGGGWFYWIAGLSAINTVTSLAGWDGTFVAGLGTTVIVDQLMKHLGHLAMIVGIPINLFAIGIYIMFGYFACRRARWAFIAGMILYGLDSLIFIGVGLWLAVGFHGWALYGLYSGLKADSTARTIEAQMHQQASVNPTTPTY